MLSNNQRRLQSGVIALTLTTALLAVSLAYLSTHAFAHFSNHRQQHNRAVLRQAQQALIGYAVSYPDRVNAHFGPGYLPCPANSHGGVAAPACSLKSGLNLGRFPWHTLRTNELYDATGSALWYAVAQSHRYNPKQQPLNVDTAATLFVDGQAAAAVVLAPGRALRGQEQRRARWREPGQFLEAANANRDVAHFSRLNTSANDELLALDHARLMLAVERRVLSELAVRLRTYASLHGGHYPWLVPLHPPATDNNSSSTTRPYRGRLPFHYYDYELSRGGDGQFTTDVQLNFEFVGQQLKLIAAGGHLDRDCLRQMPCRWGAHEIALAGPATCAWWSPDPLIPPHTIARCELFKSFALGDGRLEYRVTFSLRDDDGEVEISGPTATHDRQRRVATSEFDQFTANGEFYFDVAIRFTDPSGAVSSAELGLTEQTRGSITVAGIRYALDINRGELPVWVIRNGWLDSSVLAWAPSHCTPALTCLNLVEAPDKSPEALLIGAGTRLSDQHLRSPGAPLSAWFESTVMAALEYRAPFQKLVSASDSNDRIQIVSPLR